MKADEMKKLTDSTTCQAINGGIMASDEDYKIGLRSGVFP